MSNDGRHRLSYIIATLGPSTDNEKELITMLMAGIARQWIEGVDIARVLHSDGEEIAKNRIEIFRGQSTKRNLTTRIYLDTDQESPNTEEYIAFSNSIKPDIVTFPKSLGLDFFRGLSSKIESDSKICVRFLKTDSVDDADDFLYDPGVNPWSHDSRIPSPFIWLSFSLMRWGLKSSPCF